MGNSGCFMFDEKLKNYVNLIDDSLKKILPNSNKFCVDFVDSIKYGVLNGGKRLRPVLTLAVCDMFNGNLDAAVLFACGVELIHAGSLIHDDLPCMDNDDLRRGLPSCHVKFGETMAVLAGDGLFLSAFKFLTMAKRFDLSSHKIVRACEFLSKMAGFDGMVLGQAMDMNSSIVGCVDECSVDVLAGLKTACLIRAACVLGVIAADVDNEVEIKIDKFANYVGLAFQIYDDWADFNEPDYELKNSKFEKLSYATVFKDNLAFSKKINYYIKKALNEIVDFKNSEFLNYLINFTFKNVV